LPAAAWRRVRRGALCMFVSPGAPSPFRRAILARCRCRALMRRPAQPAGAVCERARDAGLIVITAGKGDVLRLVPPLVVTHAEVDQAVALLAGAVADTLH